MCIKCGCGKKAGQPGYGMGPKSAKSSGLFGSKPTKKKAVAKKMGKKK